MCKWELCRSENWWSLPVRTFLNRLCSLSVSNSSPANTNIGLVPSGHLSFYRRTETFFSFHQTHKYTTHQIKMLVYLHVFKRYKLLNAKLKHVQHMEIKHATCDKSKVNKHVTGQTRHLKSFIDAPCFIEINLPNMRLCGLFLLCEPNRNKEQSDFLEKNSWRRVNSVLHHEPPKRHINEDMT